MTGQEIMQRGVIYIGHLPHGFYERELHQFFSQFGKVTRLRVCRSKKTGGCKGYGFIEFECDEVAKIAAETMNNYLMFEKLLKCHVVLPEEVPKNLFRAGYQSLNFMRQRTFHNSQTTTELDEKRKKKMMKKFEKTKGKLAAMGIQYNYKFGKSLKRVSFSEDLREKGDESDKVEPINAINDTVDISIKDIVPDKTPKRRSPKDRACKSKAIPLICTPEYRIRKAGLNGICSTSRKKTIQTLSVRKRSPKERKCKMNRRMSYL